MRKVLNIILVEDVLSDAKLLEWELKQAGVHFQIRRVWTQQQFIEAIEQFEPTLILSDYSLPAFDGETALRLAVELVPQLPFIFVTGAIGEELAISLLKNGATDYIMKDNLSRLPSAIERALKESDEREKHRRSLAQLRESEAQLRALFHSVMEGTILCDANRNIKLISDKFMQKALQYGISLKQGDSVMELFPEEHRSEFSEYFQQALLGKTTQVLKSFTLQNRDISLSIECKPLIKEGQNYSCIAITVQENVQPMVSLQEHVSPRFNMQAIEEARSLIAGVVGMSKVVLSTCPEGYQRDMLTMIAKNSEKATLFLSATLDSEGS